jgi:hypothetical protein
MTAVVVEIDDSPIPAPPRWLHIVSGVIWLIIALVLLSLDSTSATTLVYLVGFVLIFAGVDEFMLTMLATGWRWVHASLGVLFMIGGVMALFEPLQTFGYLAILIGWYLIIKGSLDLGRAIGLRSLLPLWGVTLAVGIAEIALGIWALGYPGRSAWLLLVWAGVGALLRAVGDFVTAFTRGA